MEPIEVGEHLVIDPRVCHGKLTFKGTRVPVQTVLVFLAEGDSIEEILESWPELRREAVIEAVRFAVASWPELFRRTTEKALRRLVKSWADQDAA